MPSRRYYFVYLIPLLATVSPYSHAIHPFRSISVLLSGLFIFPYCHFLFFVLNLFTNCHSPFQEFLFLQVSGDLIYLYLALQIYPQDIFSPYHKIIFNFLCITSSTKNSIPQHDICWIGSSSHIKNFDLFLETVSNFPSLSFASLDNLPSIAPLSHPNLTLYDTNIYTGFDIIQNSRALLITSHSEVFPSFS